MTKLTKTLMLALLLASMAREALGFSLQGQFKEWQVSELGYQLPGDIGGPQAGNEGYRWNVPVIYYAFDQSFISYFGKPGMEAVNAAFKIFNDLPPYSSITNDGYSLYLKGEPIPTDVKGPQNFSLASAGVLDVKSYVMQAIINEMGLVSPSRYTWTLRARNEETIGNVTITNYAVVKLNFDPVSGQPSSYVNGQLLDYVVEEPIQIRGVSYADAIEVPAGIPAPYLSSAVADYTLGPGEYFFGLSHDDVGGLRFLYGKNNYANEPLLTNVVGSILGSSPWGIYGGTNTTSNTVTTATNGAGTFVVTGLRPGVNKIRFQQVKYDSLLTQLFLAQTNDFTDTVITNSRAVRQSLSRVLTEPDILFVCEDNGLFDNLVPIPSVITDTATWQNNDAINGNDGTGGDAFGGPGVIVPPIRISLTDQFPYWLNSTPDFLSGGIDSVSSAVWGSFDENTETPVLYPLYLNLTLQDIQRLTR
ncbi:MAG: hypothetical protein RJA22_1298 [Verrucomicrobiota bacterium]|jgi:hypothetical protein